MDTLEKRKEMLQGDLICSAAHLCETENCFHRRPHRDEHVAFLNHMPCQSGTPAHHMSACIPVVDGRYKIVVHTNCPHCNGRGYTASEEWRDATP